MNVSWDTMEFMGKEEGAREMFETVFPSAEDSNTEFDAGSINTDTLSVDLPSDEQLEGIRSQLEKVKKVEDSMYTYIQRERLTDDELQSWRRDMNEVKKTIDDLESVLSKSRDGISMFMATGWRKSVLDEDEMKELEVIFNRWK